VIRRPLLSLSSCLVALTLFACAGADSNMSDPSAQGSPKAFAAPPTRTDAVTDEYHGEEIADPYRWLEDQDGIEVKAWVSRQNSATRAYLDGAPGRDRLERRLTELWNYGRRGAPIQAGERWLWFRNDGLQGQDVLVLGDDPDGEGRVILDPNTLSADGTSALGSVEPSKDGRYLAYSVAERGSDWHTWRILELGTGRTLSDRIEWSKFSSAAWAPDGSGFFYQRYPEPKEGEVFEAATDKPSLCFHEIGADPAEDKVVYERPDEPQWGFAPYVTEDGRYLIVTIWQGTDQRNRVAYVDLQSDSWRVVPLLMGFDAEWDFLGNEADTFYFRTNKDAPLGRIVSLDVAQFPDAAAIQAHTEPAEIDPAADASIPPDAIPEVAADAHEEFVAQGEAALQGAALFGHHLVLTYLVDATHRVVVHDLTAGAGSEGRAIELPTLGSVAGLSGRQGRDAFYLTFTSFAYPPTIFRGSLEQHTLTPFFRPDLPLDPERFEVTQVFLRGDDGTRIPLMLLHQKDLILDGSHPTYLYGYGGFNISLTPSFSVANLAWVEQGGIYAHAVLRGGGEYGEAWHRAGMLENKQNVFDDFIACARYLVRNGYTSRAKLAIGGRSNGGLLAGACLVQRPEMFGAVIPEVGVLDMLRYHKFTIGWAWAPEYGTADDPDQFAFLRAYSPLHNIREGTAYPPTLVMTGDHDDRVLPGHSYKFAAALQQAQGGPDPVLIRIDTSAGHGAGKPTAMRIQEAVDRWAFLNRALGIDG